MKILVATALTQGSESNDYHFCIEGELVWVQLPCDRDGDDPDGPCGCGRGFAGAASHRATTSAMVIDSEMTRDEMVLAFQTSLSDGGWPADWADAVADENLILADHFPLHSVIGRRIDEVVLRAVWVQGQAS